MGPTQVVPVADQEILFIVEPPYELSDALVIADIDGDSTADAIVEIESTSAGEDGSIPWSTVIVRGPLYAETVLPSEAWVTVDAHEIDLLAAELTGDDGLDLLVEYEEGPNAGTSWIVPFPYDGSLTPGPTWMPFNPPPGEWSLEDADHDGTADLILATDSIEITWGPSMRWHGVPDVIVTPSCTPDGYRSYWDGQPPSWTFPGDLDGNGSPELVVPLYDDDFDFDEVYYNDCGGFTASLPETGVVDPFSSTNVVSGLYDSTAKIAGDWSPLDGLQEVLVATNPLLLTDRLLLSPITLLSGGILGAGAVDAAAGLSSVGTLGVDLLGDGAMDAFGQSWGSVVVFPAEPLQLSDPTVDSGWELGPDTTVWGAYSTSGNGWLVLVDDASSIVRRLDRGPAAPL
jgi:hypothetical protein